MTNIGTILFSATGIFSWTIWIYLPAVTSGLIAVVHLFKIIENEIIPRDKDIEEVSKLRYLFFSYWNQMEKLWIEYNINDMEEPKALEQFYSLRDYYLKEIKPLETKLDIREISKLDVKAEKTAKAYLNQYHNNNQYVKEL